MHKNSGNQAFGFVLEETAKKIVLYRGRSIAAETLRGLVGRNWRMDVV